ncbi:hypothetical protein D3C87_891800 [compost metagenome]
MTTSMHRGAFAPVSGPGHPVALREKRIEYGQDGLFTGFRKGPAGDLLGVPQKLFGFGQFFHAVMVPRLGFSGIPFHLSRVEAT